MYKISANTLLLGKNIVSMTECHSTNSEAIKLTQQSSIMEGTVVITNNQISGRGQRGNNWESQPSNNLTFSLILKPTALAITDQFYLNIFTSLAIHDYIKEKTNALVQVKWPNDIMVNGKKICGILIENQIQGSKFINCIIGIGLNVNQQHFNIQTANSLHLITGKSYDLPHELDLLLHKLEVRYFQLNHLNYKALKEDYLKSLYWIGELHTFFSQSEKFEGRILGINDAGLLQIETKDGLKAFGLKDISYID